MAVLEALHIVHLKEDHASKEELQHYTNLLREELREAAVDLYDAMLISFI